MDLKSVDMGLWFKDKKEKDYVKFVAINMVFGIFIYISLLSQFQTNHYDGLWQEPYFIADKWEISIGRWFWPILDKMRMGYAGDPFNSYLAIFFMVIGNLFLIDIFEMIRKKRAYIVSIMILSSTAFCTFLSYRYMSPTFGLSYLLSNAAVWILYRMVDTWLGIFFSSAALCFSLALYQANLGCTCLIVIAVVLIKSFQEPEFKNIIKLLLKSGAMVIIACIVYKLIWDFILRAMNMEANTYQGAGNVSVSVIIRSLPEQLVKTYMEFYHYYFNDYFKHSIFQNGYFYKVIFLLLIILLFLGCYVLVRKRNIWHLAIFLIAALLIPAACNVSMFLAPSSVMAIQQTAPMAIFLPVVFCVISKLLQKDSKICYMQQRCMIGIFLLILYGNIYMTATDLEVMHEGRTASEFLLENIVSTLFDMGLYSDEDTYLFVGRISDNPMFRKTALWDKANDYARYGEHWINHSDSNRMTYNGLLRNIGVNLLMGEDQIYEKYIQLDEVTNMPLYPEEGSIQKIGEQIVIKVSDVYE